MKKINVLSPGFTSPNSAAFLYPFILFKEAFKTQGFNVKILNKITDEITQCDYLFIDSKFFKHSWAKNFGQTLEIIAALNEKTKVIWCDQSDSTGTFLGQVLPYVHRYLKAQLLKDRQAYMHPHYASRIFTDYYHRKYGVEDKEPYIVQPAANIEYLDKLDVSWNSCFMHYGLIGPYLLRARSRIPLNAMLHFSKHLKSANSARPIDFVCRMGISYSRDTVCFQRKKMRELLSNHVPTDKLSRRKYFLEMDRSKVCVSPFGLGEVTLKDFECFLSGSLLLKPDMGHMDTWPYLYEDGKSYIAHDWDLSNVIDLIDWALDHENERLEIAQSAQDRYALHTIHKDAPEIFVKHFMKIIDGCIK